MTHAVAIMAADIPVMTHRIISYILAQRFAHKG
jgi:hypothetical protein